VSTEELEMMAEDGSESGSDDGSESGSDSDESMASR
jgi:hypothetical protein